ncbi:MAG: YncE family protein [Actinomycetota bacterium]|nr:YncE family protein [Actinomycetota bacterium]
MTDLATPRHLRLLRQPLRRRLAAIILVVALPGCGGDRVEVAPPPAPAPDLPPAAEPAQSPVPSEVPAGEVLDLETGGGPEGMVADPVTGLVVIALRQPNRLVLVDGRAGEVLRTVPVPGAARHLQLAAPGGPVLVPGEDSDVLAEVTLPDGNVTAETTVGRQPHDAAAVDGRTFVADEIGGTTSVIEDGAVVRAFPEPVQPGGVVVTGGRVGVVDVRGNTLSVYDTAGTRSFGSVEAGAGPTHAVADDRGGVVVADTRGDALLVFRLDPPELVERVALPGTPYGLAVDPRRDMLWVTLTAANRLVGFRLTDGPLEQVTSLPTVRQPNTVAVDPLTGRVFVASATDATLQILAP